MNDPRFITLAIHTYAKALRLKALLESEGIDAVLQNVNLETPEISSGIRVRVHVSDLPYAIRIVENPDIFSLDQHISPRLSDHREILIPVDFSSHSHQAVITAFSFAERQSAVVHLLHTFEHNFQVNPIQLSAVYSYDTANILSYRSDYQKAQDSMENYAWELRDLIKKGALPPVKFSTQIMEGIPEEVILNVAKQRSSALIVMGTRGSNAKNRDLIGSVTAEVLDSCRLPVFTVPSQTDSDINPDINSKSHVRIMMFVELIQEDFIALDILNRFFDLNNRTLVTFVKLDRIPASSHRGEFAAVTDYASAHYPECNFESLSTTIKLLIEQLRSTPATLLPDLIVVPSRKKNVFARLFNPGVAHRLLFLSDIPMMVIPI